MSPVLRLVLVVTMILTLIAPGVSEAIVDKLLTSGSLRKAGDLVLSWAAGKAIDYALDLAQKTAMEEAKKELEDQLPRLLQSIATSIGEERQAREDELLLVREQLELLERTLRAEHEEDLQAVLADQRALGRRVDDLKVQMSQLEAEVDDLSDRVSRLEQALISECRDLVRAPPFGAQGFRVRDPQKSALAKFSRSEWASVSTRVLLNACTPDLTLRGMLIQVAAITYEAGADVSLHVTFKHLRLNGFDPVHMNQLARYEFPLHRAMFPVDGQVLEIFIPYADIPFPSPSERIAVAFVVTVDGRIVYTMPDRALHCTPGQRMNCRWGR